MKGEEVQVCISLRQRAWCFPFQTLPSFLALLLYTYFSFFFFKQAQAAQIASLRPEDTAGKAISTFAKDLLKPSTGTNQNAGNTAFVTQLTI